MEMLSSEEYAKVISETIEEKEIREAYEANLIAMGKDSANQIQDGYKQGIVNAIKHIMDTYKSVRDYYSEKGMEGLTFEVIDVMFAEAVEGVLEEI